jgi:hypothetical protein
MRTSTTLHVFAVTSIYHSCSPIPTFASFSPQRLTSFTFTSKWPHGSPVLMLPPWTSHQRRYSTSSIRDTPSCRRSGFALAARLRRCVCSIAATSFKYFIPCHNIIHRSNPFLPSCHPSSTKCRRTFRRNSNLQKMLDVGSKMAPLLMALLRQWSHRQWTSCYRFQWALSNLVFS